MSVRWLALAAIVAVAVTSSAGPPAEVWWSFRPLVRPPVPVLSIDQTAPTNPIDAFIRAKLAEKGLRPAAEADRPTLIRRVTLDLTGLLPKPDAVKSFVADTDPLAYERLVDRLLASPAYGERQARLWMDAVHFAETNGHETDSVRPNAWPYRDYLIAAFNADTPYGRFIQEQLAADALFPTEPRLTPALGFIAAGPWDESSLRGIQEDNIDRVAGHYLDRDDMVTTVFGTVQSLTVHCARCHDHKFDPISQADYYGLQAVFAGVDRADRIYDLDPAVTRRRQEASGRLAAAVGASLAVPSARPWYVLVNHTVLDGPAAAVKAIPSPLVVYAGTHDFKPDGNFKPSKAPRPVNVLKRGDVRRPGPAATSASLACLPAFPGRLDVADNAPEHDRRAALAQWLTHRDNPLTWRSIVNRAWQWHFGRGIVDSPNDFGKMGSKPSHPELLDWLAADFRDSGGSLKRLHRLIVTSATYRQASAGAARDDPDNRFLAHMSRGRLDAEQVRDAILQVSGRLDRRMGGPSDQQFASKPGVEGRPMVVDYPAFAWDRPEGHRRSVYRFAFRTLADPFVECLDGADASQLTPVRNVSVTGPQALALLNNDFVLAHSKALATVIEQQSQRPRRQINLACERVWGRAPTAVERAEFVKFVRKHGLANLCRVLFNSNEFLFVD
jgi:hypothetical protein